MNKHNINLLRDLAIKESKLINKAFNKSFPNGIIISKLTLENWIIAFDEEKRLKTNKEKIEALEIFSKSLLSSVEDEYQIHLQKVLSIPGVSADELVKSYESNSILLKMIQKKQFNKPPSWTKNFNKSILD